jgi:pimeloyl-[acyl-carrier protein] methyl ester esterase
LPVIRCPVLLLMGERDPLVPAAAGRQTAQMSPGARLELIAGAGHAPFLVHPGAVASAIQGFLAPLHAAGVSEEG